MRDPLSIFQEPLRAKAKNFSLVFIQSRLLRDQKPNRGLGVNVSE